jgi:hypothetical protein
MLMNRLVEAKAEFAKVPVNHPSKWVGMAILAVRSRDLAEAERIIAQVRERVGAAGSYQYAQIYSQAGDATRAFAELDNAVRVKDAGLQYLKTDPFLDPIRGDPRHAALLKRLNFPIWS